MNAFEIRANERATKFDRWVLCQLALVSAGGDSVVWHTAKTLLESLRGDDVCLLCSLHGMPVANTKGRNIYLLMEHYTPSEELEPLMDSLHPEGL